MFPGFINTYKENNNIIIYFFRGIDDNGNVIYKDADLRNMKLDYEIIKQENYYSIFKIKNDKISKIVFEMIPINNNKYNKEFKTINI